MKWWLTVFFLFGDQWIPGDYFDGWASRAYETRPECEERRHFAEEETLKYPLQMKAIWVCNEGKPARKPPPPSVEAGRPPAIAQLQGEDKDSGPAQGAAVSALHPGLRLFTHDDEPWITEDAIGLRFTGPLTPPFAENLRELFLVEPHAYNHLVLELDSPGGELGYVSKIVEVLKEIRTRATLVTRVMGGQMCASGCVAVYMQGTSRKASGASVWVFHGACSPGSTVPSPSGTEAFLRLLEDSGVSTEFLCDMREKGYVDRPGNLFLSGHELFHEKDAGIIQELLPRWQPEDPVFPRPVIPR